MFRQRHWLRDGIVKVRGVLREALGGLQLWRTSIQKVEGRHGVFPFRFRNVPPCNHPWKLIPA